MLFKIGGREGGFGTLIGDYQEDETFGEEVNTR